MKYIVSDRHALEVWVVDLVADVVHVIRGAESQQVRAGESPASLTFPDLALEVAAILG